MIGDNYLHNIVQNDNTIECPETETVVGMAKELILCRKIIAAVRAGRDKELHLLLVDYDILTSR